MDDLLPLLLLAVMYIGPAVWRKLISKNKVQMHEPKQVIVPELEFVSEDTLVESTNNSVDLPKPVISQAESTSTISEEMSPWRGKLTENVVINGVIFAEVLQPPRAYRPFEKRMK